MNEVDLRLRCVELAISLPGLRSCETLIKAESIYEWVTRDRNSEPAKESMINDTVTPAAVSFFKNAIAQHETFETLQKILAYARSESDR